MNHTTKTYKNWPAPAIDARCKCSMSISLLGDGCRYCQPQEYIETLHRQIAEEREEAQAMAVRPKDAFDETLEALRKQSPTSYLVKVLEALRGDVLQPAVNDKNLRAKAMLDRVAEMPTPAFYDESDDPFAWLASLKCNALYLDRDGNHSTNYVTAKQWIEEWHPEDFARVDPDELATMKATNTIWSLQIYPDTPIGSYTFYGATAESVIRTAMAATKGADKP